MEQEFNSVIKLWNAPEEIQEGRYVVARIGAGECWYWCNYEDEFRAFEVAREVEGFYFRKGSNAD